MIKTSIEAMADPIGFDIGTSDNEVQANLLNGLCRGLYNGIPNEHDRALQYSHVVDKLDNKAMHVLKGITEFIKLKEEEL